MTEQAGALPLLLKQNRTEQENGIIQQLYKSSSPEALAAQLRQRKVLPFAAATFVKLGLNAAFWDTQLCAFRTRNQRIISLLDRVYQTLHAHGVVKMFLSENLAALLKAGGDLALFCSGDADNYADICEKEKIYAAFDAMGFERQERFSGKRQIAAEFFPHDALLGDDFYFSVDFYPLARLKLPCFVRADDFVDWNEMSRYGDTEITLPPTQALLYICLLHISLHSFSRAPDIRLYLDVLYLSNLSPDYKQIEQWEQRDGTKRRCQAAAFLARQLLNAEMPEAEAIPLQRLLRRVYDKQSNDLRYEPHGLRLFAIELLCEDGGVLLGLRRLLFPYKAWMRETYGSAGVLAYAKHWLHLVR